MRRILSIGLLAATVAACGGDAERERLPDVVLVVLDTVRADRLGCYGGPEGATPHLDAFAARADRHARCAAASSWTLPSHASMFTGLFPLEHGTHGFEVDGFVDNVHPLHPDHTTLAEELRGLGYETSAFVANRVYLSPRYGIDQGFDTYEVMKARAPEVLSRALEHLGSRDPERPQLLFVNLMDAHRGYVSYSDEELADLPPERTPDRMLEALCELVMNDGEEPGALGEEVLGLYDRAITRQDAALGVFFDALEERGVMHRAAVIVTSDHGEAFGTHGIVEHAKDVYEPLVAVPLVVRAPGQSEGRVLEEIASHVDLGGLVARCLPGEAGAALGASFPRVPGSHPVLSEIHFARPRDIVKYRALFQHERTALREGDLKLIIGGDGPELYDLGEDAGELRDLAEERPDVLQAMTATVDSFVGAHAYAGERLAPRPLTDGHRRSMSELGYGPGGGEGR